MRWVIYRDRNAWLADKAMGFADSLSNAKRVAGDEATHISNPFSDTNYAKGPDGKWRKA